MGASPSAAIGDGGRLALLDVRAVTAFVALLALWALCNPFFGVDASNLIYVGRALADLDPAGVGRDAMFVHDGQSGFTTFTVLFRALSEAIGLSRATMVLASAAVASAFVGAAALAAAISEGRAKLLIVVFAATLPVQYGGYKLFAYAEVAATPRPFAEALVLCALAALLHRRHLAAVALMAAAALLHPIMAASGIAVLGCWLVLDDRRWLAPMALAAAVVASVAIAKIAPFDRLTHVVDPEWAGILRARTPHLFPSLWLDGWVGRLIVRTATLLVAARFAAPRTRRLFLLALPVGLTGLLAAHLLGERAGSVIVLQAQTWRMMWLVFALATAAAAIATIELWRRGGTSRVALGFLALAWAFADIDGAASLFALVAVGIVYGIDPQRYAHVARWLDMLVVLLLAWAAYGLARTELAILAAHATGDAAALELRRSAALDFDYTPIAVLAAAFVLMRIPRPSHRAMAALAVVGAILAGVFWDQRSAANTYYDSAGAPPDLAATLGARSGEILWIGGGRQAWWWLHRPQWLAPIQGAGLVFSRELALTYGERSARAIEAGLAEPGMLEPLRPHAPGSRAATALGLTAFCAAADAPAWVVVPLDGAVRLAEGIVWTEWTAPIAELQATSDGTWRLVSRYAVIACGGSPTGSAQKP